MKKKALKKIIKGLNDFAIMQEKVIQSQNNSVIKNHEEVTIATNAVKAIRIELEETKEALSRSRSMVAILRSNKESVSVDKMGEKLYSIFSKNDLRQWKFLIEEEKEYWMGLALEIISGKKIIKG